MPQETLPLGIDWSDAISRIPAGLSHEDKMIELLRYFSETGKTLAFCAGSRALNRAEVTLKRYCRMGGVAFPDYVPIALRDESND